LILNKYLKATLKTKTMNTQKSVFKKLKKIEEIQKTELSQEKVEFSKQMDYVLNRAKDIVKSTAKQQQAYEKALLAVKQAKGMGDASGTIASLTKQANQELDKIERAAKDLDMNVRELPAYQTYNQAMDFISQIEDNIDSIKAIAKQLI
jgi:hypothetical protein